MEGGGKEGVWSHLKAGQVPPDWKSIGFVKYLLVFDQNSLVLLSKYWFFDENHWFSLMKIGFWLKNQFLLK